MFLEVNGLLLQIQKNEDLEKGAKMNINNSNHL